MKMFGQCAGLPIRRAAHDHHPIKHAGQWLGIKHLNVLAFDVLKGIDNSVLKVD